MADPWLALEFGVDPAERIAQVGAAHEAFLTAGAAPHAGAGRGAPLLGTLGTTRPRGHPTCRPGRRRPGRVPGRSPVGPVLPLFRDLLGGIAQDGAHLMAVCDADGRLLWVEGHPGVLRHAERMNFVPGARWDETHAGTNAPGTALAVDHSVQIFATEHFSRPVQRWTCAAAPIHDPAPAGCSARSTSPAGTTWPIRTVWPSSVPPPGPPRRSCAAGQPVGARRRPTVTALGRDEARTAGRRPADRRLGRRHSELLVLLLHHPEGPHRRSARPRPVRRRPAAPGHPARRAVPVAPGARPRAARLPPLPAARHRPRRLHHPRPPAGPGRCGGRARRVPRAVAARLGRAGSDATAPADRRSPPRGRAGHRGPGAARGLDRDARRRRRPGRVAGPGAGVAGGRAASRPSPSRASTSSPGSTRWSAQRSCNVRETSLPPSSPSTAEVT